MAEKQHQYGEVFDQLIDIWQQVTGKKSKVKDKIPPDITKRMEDLENNIKMMTDITSAIQEQAGTDKVENAQKYVQENEDSFSKKELQFFKQVEQMKGEVTAVRNLLKVFSDAKKENCSRTKPIEAQTSEDKKLTKKEKAKLIRKRKRRLKRAGINDKWTPI